VLRRRVEEMEKENCKKEEELGAKSQHIASLLEQLANQTQALAELREELQSKSLQIAKLQELIPPQGDSGDPSPGTPGSRTSRGSSLRAKNSRRSKDTVNRRRGAKAGVSAEPTSRTYDSSSLPKFSFEEARVPKDAR
jgi:cGMP-dependent protein kinase 2